MSLCGIGHAANAVDGIDFVTWVTALPRVQARPVCTRGGAHVLPSSFGSGSAHDESMEGLVPVTMPREFIPPGHRRVGVVAIRAERCIEGHCAESAIRPMPCMPVSS